MRQRDTKTENAYVRRNVLLGALSHTNGLLRTWMAGPGNVTPPLPMSLMVCVQVYHIYTWCQVATCNVSLHLGTTCRNPGHFTLETCHYILEQHVATLGTTLVGHVALAMSMESRVRR